VPIVVTLDEVMARRGMTLTQLAEAIDITLANLSILKTGKAKAVRFSTMAALCRVLECQPGEITAFTPDEGDRGAKAGKAS